MAWECGMFRSLKPIIREKIIKERNMCTFCMRHVNSAECYGKGADAKPPVLPLDEMAGTSRNFMKSLLVNHPQSM